MLRRFRNNSEDHIQKQIRAVVGSHRAELHEKVRLADVVDISKLNRRELGTFALQAHLDFVVIDEGGTAVFAIEFDGLGHDTRNDAKKNSICEQAHLPLFRIHGFQEVREINAMTLTRYLVELVFHARIFQQMKEDGHLEPSEPFMLSAFLKKDAKHLFDSEFDFVVNANGKLTRALREYGMAEDDYPHFSKSHLVVRSPEDEFRAYSAINSSKGPIVGSASVRIGLPSTGFLSNVGSIHAELAQFADGMACDDLYENIRLLGIGAGHVVKTTDEFLAEIEGLAVEGYDYIFGGSSSKSNANLLEAFAKGRGGRLF